MLRLFGTLLCSAFSFICVKHQTGQCHWTLFSRVCVSVWEILYLLTRGRFTLQSLGFDLGALTVKMGHERPPDLRFSRDLCEAVKHDDHLQFTCAHGRARLENVLTGECHCLPADSAFHISVTGRGYIVSISPEGQEVTQWASQLLSWSGWISV